MKVNSRKNLITDSKNKKNRGRIWFLYHFMYPDEVAGAHHFDGLMFDLVEKGWSAVAMPSNRSCRANAKKYDLYEEYNRVEFERVWRPDFPQKRLAGRLLNSVWMMLVWVWRVLRSREDPPNIVIVGTDPIFAALVAIPIRFINKEIKLVHWCFDLHPEASIVSEHLSKQNLAVKIVRRMMKKAYSKFDLIADIGNYMRKNLRKYDHSAEEIELTPWALKEPESPPETDPEIHKEIFGDAKIGILYSGNFGEAHSYKNILALARSLRNNPEIQFRFSVRGNRADELRNQVNRKDSNIDFLPFASLEELPKRLAAADIHLVCLKSSWSGIAVPSKFFGGLAVGRPVLFSGGSNSAIAKWIKNFKVGWLLNGKNIQEVSSQLIELSGDKSQIDVLQKNAFKAYQDNFSRQKVTERWDQCLRNLLNNVSSR